MLPVEDCCEKQSAGKHRCDSGCGVIEDGGIKIECAKVSPVPPSAVAIVFNLDRVSNARCDVAEPPTPPFEISNLPQFVIHTALPIRGPSFAS